MCECVRARASCMCDQARDLRAFFSSFLFILHHMLIILLVSFSFHVLSIRKHHIRSHINKVLWIARKPTMLYTHSTPCSRRSYMTLFQYIHFLSRMCERLFGFVHSFRCHCRKFSFIYYTCNTYYYFHSSFHFVVSVLSITALCAGMKFSVGDFSYSNIMWRIECKCKRRHERLNTKCYKQILIVRPFF